MLAVLLLCFFALLLSCCLGSPIGVCISFILSGIFLFEPSDAYNKIYNRTINYCTDLRWLQLINPFMPMGLFYLNSLDRSISYIGVSGYLLL